MMKTNNYPRIEDEDAKVKIKAFMVYYLGLCGNELIAYAIVYGFSYGKEPSTHVCSNQVAAWCRITESEASNVLNSLVSKGLIFETDVTGDDGRAVTVYRINIDALEGCEDEL